jgi:hypothetical protein
VAAGNDLVFSVLVVLSNSFITANPASSSLLRTATVCAPDQPGLMLLTTTSRAAAGRGAFRIPAGGWVSG